MFNKTTSKPQNRIDSLIGATTRIEGNVIFSGGLRVEVHFAPGAARAVLEPAHVPQQQRREGDERADEPGADKRAAEADRCADWPGKRVGHGQQADRSVAAGGRTTADLGRHGDREHPRQRAAAAGEPDQLPADG